MALPTALTSQAYDTVDKAMSSGARGSTEKTTDYSALSDAFMKKAALDTQILNMQMDQQMSRATLMGNLEMSKADLYMKSASLALQESQFQRQMQAQEDADKMSPFEQITGVLAGAAQGALAGKSAFPDAKNAAVIGGVLGGASALGSGGSRRAQSNQLANIGAISNAAVDFRRISDYNKGQDANQTWAKTFEDISGKLRKADPGTDYEKGLQQELNAHIDGYTKVGLSSGLNLQQIAATQGELRKQAHNGFDPSDPKQMATRNIRQRIVNAQSDPRFKDPATRKEAIQEFQSANANDYTLGFGKSATKLQMQGFLGEVSPQIAQEYYSGKSVSAIPKTKQRTPEALTSDSGVNNVQAETVQPTEGRTIQQQRQPADSGLSTENYIVPSAAPNISAGSQAWGVDMDNTESMLQDISKRSVEMSKDPSLAQKALGQDPAELEIEPPSTKEKIYRGVDKFMGLGTEDGKPGVIKTFGNRANQMEAERQQDLTDRQLKMQAEQGPTDAPVPTIISKQPETAAKEQVFKNTTDADEMMDTFDLRGRFDNTAQADKVTGLANAGLEVNIFREKVYDPKIQKILMKLTPEQRRLYQDHMKGLGDEAMLGQSDSVAASAAGVSAQEAKSKFERSVKLSNQGRGNRNGLSGEEIKTLMGLETQATALGRQIGMGYNTGAFSNKDAEWAVNSVFNLFEQDPDVASSSNDELQNMIWNKFHMTLGSYKSADDKKQEKKAEYTFKQQNKSSASKNDEYMLFE